MGNHEITFMFTCRICGKIHITDDERGLSGAPPAEEQMQKLGWKVERIPNTMGICNTCVNKE